MSEYTPITGELRKYATVAWDPWPEARDRLYQMCDAIDSIHAQLERENTALKAELDRVLGEQEEHAHTRGESITGELREYATNDSLHYCSDYLAIADRIDAEHERELRETCEDIVRDVRCEYVRLPVDADGVPIHVGDALKDADNPTKPFTVSYIELEEKGWWVFACGMGRRPDKYRHTAPDTWERIVEEVLQRGHDDYPLNVDIEPYVARCKALCERTKEDA